MSSALSSEQRARFRAYIEEGLSGRAAAAQLKLSAATGVRWQRKWRETGAIAPDVQGRPPCHGKLAAHQGLLEELVAQDGDITLPELSGALESATGIVAHAASIGRFLRKLGYTYQKKSPPLGSMLCMRLPVTRVATERLRARVNHLRQDWFKYRIPKMQAHPDRLVFIASRDIAYAMPCQPVDETSVKTNLTRLRGRSLCGKRLEMTAPFGAWGTQTFIAGLTHNNLIAPWVIKGAPLMHVNMHCRAVNGRRSLRCIHSAGPCAGTAAGNRRDLRQPRDASQQGCCAGFARYRLLVHISAALLARSQSALSSLQAATVR